MSDDDYEYKPPNRWGGLLVSAPFALVGVWAGVAAVVRFTAIRDNPDMNFDGRFSILDVLPAIGSILNAVGVSVQNNLANTGFGQFLEMSINPTNQFWSITFSIIINIVGLLGLTIFSNVLHEMDIDNKIELEMERDATKSNGRR